MAETAKLFEIPKYDQNYLELVRTQLLEHLRATGKSQTMVAKAIGFSAATLTGFIRNNYQGDMAEVAGRIQDYLLRETKRQIAPKVPGFVETSFAGDALSVIEYAHLYRDIGMIYGDAGVGKTFTIEHYADDHHNAIVITAGIDLCSPKAVMQEIMEQLGRKEYGSLYSMSRTINQALKGSDKLLIIDEANHLTFRAREWVRKIHEQAGIGVVYCGNHDLYAQMHGNKGVIYAQLLSRIGIRRCLVREELTMEDIKLIFEQFEKLDDDCLEFLHTYALGEGGLRFAKKLYMLAATMAYSSDQPLELKHFQKALGMAMDNRSEGR